MTSKGEIINKKDIIEWVVFLLVLFLVWSHVNVVVSNSMYPIMERGDLVVVENAHFEFDPNNLNVGDIVVYNAHWPLYQYNEVKGYISVDNKSFFVFEGDKTKPVIHRIIEKLNIDNKTYYVVKGDNNPTYDPELVSPSQIRQKVVTINGKPLVIPYIGYLSIWLKSHVYLVIILLIILYLYDHFRAKNEGEKE
ncbi:S26 family signal peptidase [Methanotorris igneus]|uniref:Peptidase S26B, signal peptidase n=1 Tax=Methanotorris igneus (strain DSM 5666 / JCM 11834 / Kol 5) TaxID=880724 RepID=F6BCF8_METIK|nr:peptidase S26B, signal peptidase [Methanotorris igneus Kol 5]